MLWLLCGLSGHACFFGGYSECNFSPFRRLPSLFLFFRTLTRAWTGFAWCLGLPYSSLLHLVTMRPRLTPCLTQKTLPLSYILPQSHQNSQFAHPVVLLLNSIKMSSSFQNIKIKFTTLWFWVYQYFL